MINLTELIEYDLAKLLNNKIWSDKKYAYAAEDLEVTWGTWIDYLTTKKYKEGELITVECGDDVHGKVYYALTYAELIKFLDKCYGIVIDFQPAFTFSTKLSSSVGTPDSVSPSLMIYPSASLCVFSIQSIVVSYPYVLLQSETSYIFAVAILFLPPLSLLYR